MVINSSMEITVKRLETKKIQLKVLRRIRPELGGHFVVTKVNISIGLASDEEMWNRV